MGKAPRIAVPLGVAAVALVAMSGLALSQEIVQPIPPGASAYPSNPAPAGQSQSILPDWATAQNRIVAQSNVDAAIDYTITEWRRLQQSDTLGFGAYASFIMANPGWPGEDRMRRLAEAGVNPAAMVPSQVAAYFAKFPPQTATGQARYALALSALGRTGDARDAARRAWAQGPISADDEQRLLSLFAGMLTPDDHYAHADILLWAGDRAGAQRALNWVPANRRAIIDARIAMQSRWPDVAQRMAAAEAQGGLGDAGYVNDKAKWLVANSDLMGARTLLGGRQTLVQPVAPGAAEKWLETLLASARASGNDGNWTLAYAIASKLDDAFLAGTDVSTLSLGVRDDYTSLAWLAGTAALNKLGRPADAVQMFLRYGNGARSPQTISKGFYWAGRAATAAGRQGDAEGYFRKASVYPDQYYGQLALERIGQPIPLPAPERPVEISQNDRQGFAGRTVVRAARRLGATGNWQDQSKMLRAIANGAMNDQDHVLVAELSVSINRPDLGVMAGRRALSSGLSGYTASSFPRVPVPAGHEYNWTMIHAIARQESQFDRQIVSHAGARGLMQLMPGTAQETAGKIGLSYNAASLNDTGYNVQLGSAYFKRMLDYYGGSYPLAVAAYNAGPGNVNKWLRANGDPRQGGDIVQWIEDIPISETRNYVQRVLENAVVYDQLNPRNAGMRVAAPLSRYLGKNRPG